MNEWKRSHYCLWLQPELRMLWLFFLPLYRSWTMASVSNLISAPWGIRVAVWGLGRAEAPPKAPIYSHGMPPWHQNLENIIIIIIMTTYHSAHGSHPAGVVTNTQMDKASLWGLVWVCHRPLGDSQARQCYNFRKMENCETSVKKKHSVKSYSCSFTHFLIHPSDYLKMSLGVCRVPGTLDKCVWNSPSRSF